MMAPTEGLRLYINIWVYEVSEAGFYQAYAPGLRYEDAKVVGLVGMKRPWSLYPSVASPHSPILHRQFRLTLDRDRTIKEFKEDLGRRYQKHYVGSDPIQVVYVREVFGGEEYDLEDHELVSNCFSNNSSVVAIARAGIATPREEIILATPVSREAIPTKATFPTPPAPIMASTALSTPKKVRNSEKKKPQVTKVDAAPKKQKVSRSTKVKKAQEALTMAAPSTPTHSTSKLDEFKKPIIIPLIPTPEPTPAVSLEHHINTNDLNQIKVASKPLQRTRAKKKGKEKESEKEREKEKKAAPPDELPTKEALQLPLATIKESVGDEQLKNSLQVPSHYLSNNNSIVITPLTVSSDLLAPRPQVKSPTVADLQELAQLIQAPDSSSSLSTTESDQEDNNDVGCNEHNYCNGNEDDREKENNTVDSENEDDTNDDENEDEDEDEDDDGEKENDNNNNEDEEEDDDQNVSEAIPVIMSKSFSHRIMDPIILMKKTSLESSISSPSSEGVSDEANEELDSLDPIQFVSKPTTAPFKRTSLTELSEELKRSKSTTPIPLAPDSASNPTDKPKRRRRRKRDEPSNSVNETNNTCNGNKL